jgi:hypothetical protein
MNSITPVLLNIDIYRTAHLLIKQHGEEASIHAAMKADEMLAQGNLDGKAVWPIFSHSPEVHESSL